MEKAVGTKRNVRTPRLDGGAIGQHVMLDTLFSTVSPLKLAENIQ